MVLHERVPERLLDRVLEVLSNRMGMQRATFTLRQGDVFWIEASHGLDETEKRRGWYRFGEGITVRMAVSGKPQLVSDISKGRRFLNRTDSHKVNEHLAFLCVPVLYHESIIGTLSMECSTASEAELEANLEFLEIIGNLTSEAMMSDTTDFRGRVDAFERELITSALRERHGNMAAARQLNLSSRVIRYKINRLHIHPEAFTHTEPHE